jgi:hypothetical protein
VDRRLGYALERAVAHQAARERSGSFAQIEAVHNFAQLLPGRAAAQPVPASHRAALQQIPVPSDDDAPLRGAELRDAGVPILRIVERVEAEQTQQPRELAEMRVEHETRSPQRLRAQTVDRVDFQPLEDGVNGDPFTTLETIIEAHRKAIHQNQVDFRMRHTERLDRVLDRRRALERMLESNLAPRRGQEIVQLLVKAKCRPALPELAVHETRCRLNHSATRAGFASCSASMMTSSFINNCPGRRSSASAKRALARIRPPDFTGAGKRTLSKP